MREKIKLLFLSAQPNIDECSDRELGYIDERLRSDRELGYIDSKIRAGLNPHAFEIVTAPALQRTELSTALMRHRPQIVHFSGHSDAEFGIYLEDDRGVVAPVSGVELAELFAIVRGTIRIVFLNSCESAAVARPFQHFVDHTIAMNGRISDGGAIALATEFYNALSMSESVPSAFWLAV